MTFFLSFPNFLLKAHHLPKLARFFYWLVCSDFSWQELAFFHVSQYSFEKHDTVKSEWNLLNLKTGDISLLTDDSNVSEIFWLGEEDSQVLYINSTSSDVPGGVDLWASDVRHFGKR